MADRTLSWHEEVPQSSGAAESTQATAGETAAAEPVRTFSPSRVSPTRTFSPTPLSGARLSSPTPLYRPALWASTVGKADRPRQERDSLRSRSQEGRPGSRKHRRWLHDTRDTNSALRKAMKALGEDDGEIALDRPEDQLPQPGYLRPSAFYKLMESEGAEGALEALQAAEDKRQAEPSRARQQDPARVSEKNVRLVRHTFTDTWQFIQSSEAAQELLKKLESAASVAFGSDSELDEAVLLWLLSWDGSALTTKSGSPPANKMEVTGLTPAQRKVAHQLARCLGLHSESRIVNTSDDKVLTIRPPHSCSSGQGSWMAPFSVAEVLTATAR
eukprot:gnl/TRDRNA2_/TRDRNA2_198157_c0_seq1.p1 gnl/TRDRNA2_/TRDRNA2_198157_c0~~gnl/TRDRNA2_/TRDRNA2_198157_c0_seq1.p1  ORF type:complete len:330 (-),score=58.16 gnl/TRDRNA2_/TRDRNA2_198157_c0_seq1:69-1058(-)